MPLSSRATIGVALLALVALMDIAWPVLTALDVLGTADAPPTPVLVVFALLGLVALGTALPTLQGHRPAGWALLATRIVSVLLVDLPAVFLDAPGWVRAIVSTAIALSLLGIGLAMPLFRGTGAERTAARRVA